jgi:predicted phosphodiesterase
MRYLILSDIHSNLEALDASLYRADRYGYDKILCCGDVVGYGPNPAEVMARLDELGVLCIRGNHDRAAAGLTEPVHFNIVARRALDWTRQQLSPTQLDWLAALPAGPLAIADQAQLVHGSGRDEDEYVVTEEDAWVNLALTSAPITFFGHTHEPVVFGRDEQWIPDYDARGVARFPLSGEKILVNPGSVGQPRDGDPRSSFLIWDSEGEYLEFHRAEYDFLTTQKRMRAAYLPDLLILRLALGR